MIYTLAGQPRDRGKRYALEVNGGNVQSVHVKPDNTEVKGKTIHLQFLLARPLLKNALASSLGVGLVLSRPSVIACTI